jgi:hypothetical protein
MTKIEHAIALVADDRAAMTYQTLAQYRAALLKALRKIADAE